MPKRNRQSLKASFRQGNRPSELDFENLIDSTMNLLEDGLRKEPHAGLMLAPEPGKSAVLSVCRQSSDEQALWQVSLDQDTGCLSVGLRGRPLAVMNIDGTVTLGEYGGAVVMKGTLQAASRRGAFAQGEVPANGRWQDITEELEGCWALEVVAGCGRKNTGKHSLIVADAVHCFGARPKIRKISSHYGIRGHRIRLRWVKRGYACVLQVRTSFNYGSDIRIRYHIARLWDEPFMEII